MIVVVQAVVVFRGAFLEGWNCGAVNKEEVRVTIVVVIDQGDARDHRFGLVLVRTRTAIRHKVHIRAGGDVFKTDGTAVVRLSSNCVSSCKNNSCRYCKKRSKHG